MNNADYGISLQKLICDEYGIDVNEWANAQFSANYNSSYAFELKHIIPIIFEKVQSKPVHLLSYTQEYTNGHQSISPHNFLLADGRTCSIRTMKTSDKVSPRTVGQAGFPVLNAYFADIYGKPIKNQADVRKLVYEKIHEMFPIFIDNFFQSDVTVFISKKDLSDIQVIRADEVSDYSFFRDEFSFTRGIDTWTESTTLKFHGKSVAEIQTHKERSFKFRFIVSAIPDWFREVKENNESFGISAESAICEYFKLERPDGFRKVKENNESFGIPAESAVRERFRLERPDRFRKVKENNESFGMSAEGAICEYFKLERPDSFDNRVISTYVKNIMPVVAEAFKNLPPAISHTGSTSGARGEHSKCSYDFILAGNKTLSLKTNRGKMVCPPEVGQPGSKTCLLYFGEFFKPGTSEITRDDFKIMVFNHIDEIMPIYVNHLFDSDWLLWIYETKEGFQHMEISKRDIKSFKWDKNKFSFTKGSLEEWNESNTVKYEDLSIGEFQVHQNRNCFKFRFNMPNVLSLLL